MPIAKIISGGQTGAERGGLNAALYSGIPHGDWCPKGRKAADRRIPENYKMTEMSKSDYLSRTEANVLDSDATVVFTAIADAVEAILVDVICELNGSCVYPQTHSKPMILR